MARAATDFRDTINLRVAPYMTWNQHYYCEIYVAPMFELIAHDADRTLKLADCLLFMAAIYGYGYSGNRF